MLGRVVMLFAALMLIGACAQPFAPSDVEPLASPGATDPFIRGTVTARDPQWGIFVQAVPGGAYRAESAWVRSDKKTQVKAAGSGVVQWGSLATGQTVSVWINGPVMESLPVKVVAKTIIVE